MRCYRASNCYRNPQPLWWSFENPRPCERSTRGTQVHPRVRFEVRARFARNRGVPVRCCSNVWERFSGRIRANTGMVFGKCRQWRWKYGKRHADATRVGVVNFRYIDRIFIIRKDFVGSLAIFIDIIQNLYNINMSFNYSIYFYIRNTRAT